MEEGREGGHDRVRERRSGEKEGGGRKGVVREKRPSRGREGMEGETRERGGQYQLPSPRHTPLYLLNPTTELTAVLSRKYA